MKRKLILLFVIFVTVSKNFATKVVSVSNNDWNELISWNTSLVPENPDTIIIRHYITLSRDLVISAPTVLIIEEEGTLCGDYQLDVACGATLINRGYIFLGSAIIRNGYNYNAFSSKISVSIQTCGSSNGFSNVGPTGTMDVWPPVLCKTTETNWKGTTGIAANGSSEELLSISPNPINSGYLTVKGKGELNIKLYDTKGALLYSNTATDKDFIDLHGYANGFYFVSVTYKNAVISRKVLVQQ